MPWNGMYSQSGGYFDARYHMTPTSPSAPWNSHFAGSGFGLKVAKAVPYVDPVVGVWEGYNNYSDRYANVSDQDLRLRMSAERALTTTVTGILVGVLGVAVGAVICGASAGTLCVVGVAVAAVAVGYGAELAAGAAYDKLNEDRVASHAVSAPIAEPLSSAAAPSWSDQCAPMF